MSGLNYTYVMRDDVVRRLAPSGTFVANLETPTVTGPNPVYIHGGGYDEDLPSLDECYNATRFNTGQQIQGGDDSIVGFDLGSQCGCVPPDLAPAPGVELAASQEPISSVDSTTGKVTHTAFTHSGFTQPDVNSDVDVTVSPNADPFASLDVGTEIYTSGCAYTLQGVNTSTRVLTIRNAGVGASRVETVA